MVLGDERNAMGNLRALSRYIIMPVPFLNVGLNITKIGYLEKGLGVFWMFATGVLATSEQTHSSTPGGPPLPSSPRILDG